MEVIFGLAVLILSVIVHEVSHGYAAYVQGDRTAQYQGRLTMNPLVHLDLWGSFIIPLISYQLGGFIIGWAKPVPYNPYNLRNKRWGEALVALAGPASNLIIAFVFGMIIRFFATGLSSNFIEITSVVVFINIILALFNLTPIPPLDGSKLLFSILPFDSRTRAILEQYGFIFVLFFIFFLWRFIFPLAGVIFSLITGIHL